MEIGGIFLNITQSCRVLYKLFSPTEELLKAEEPSVILK